MTKTTTVSITLVLLAWTVPSAALAQTTVPDWARKVRSGAPIYVTTSAGESVDGTAGPIDATSMMVSTPYGPRTLPLADIGRVQRSDRVGNGVRNGAVAGLLTGVVFAAGTDCSQEFFEDLCETAALAGLVALPAIGAALGWAIDGSIKGRDTLFDAKPPQRGTRVALGVGPRGIQARIAF